ncbi:MAG: hypothetical protein M3Q75_14260 [Gemmatimonadota bacterium]|nr:hypothetical protein [Gemmatimonadota bacterium]
MSGPSYDRAAFLENVRFMAETGESWLGAAHRLGVTPTALDKRLWRLGAHGLAGRLSGFDAWVTSGRRRHRDTAA